MKKACEYEIHMGYNYVRNAIKIEYIYSAFETVYQEDFYFKGEFHPFWEFVYVLSGSVAASGDDRIYFLNAGDIIFHKPMEFHRLWAVDNVKPHLFVMSFQIEGPYCAEFENGVYSLNNEQRNSVLGILEYLKKYSEYENDDPKLTYFLNNWDSPHVPQGIANRLEGFLLSLLEGENLSEIKEDSREEIKNYKKIISILTESVYTQVSLDDIAKACNMSKSQIKKIFSATSTIGIHKYFIKLKVAEAMKLLLQNHSVSEVSELLEFASPNYFSSVFKRETGISPLEYKKRK